MADHPPSPGSNGDDTGVGPDRGSPPSTPRWVYVFGIIAFVLALLFVILHLAGGGFRGHTLPGGHGGHTPPSSGTEHGVQQP
jgi:hypothetical protein